MPEEEKDSVKIVDVSEDEEELSPEELKELEGIMEEVEEEIQEESSNKKQEIEKEQPAEKEDTHESKGEDNQPQENIEVVNKESEEDTKFEEEILESAEDKAPTISGHVVPQDECWVLRRNKTGFTLPKELRDKIHPQQNFALVFEGHELVFYMVNEEDIPKLQLARKKAEPKSKGVKKDKRGKKKTEGPEPDFPRYFHFEIEDQDKIQDALESAFYKFAANPPAVGEAMNLVIYVLTTFVKNHRMNDSRLRQTVIFFLCHIIEQFNQPQLIDFIQREIIDDIESAYLYQISLNQLAYTSFLMDKSDKAEEFITKCIEVINKYDTSEMYAIMDSFKHLIHTLTPIEGKSVEKEKLGHVKGALASYMEKLEDFDYQVQYIEMVERMGFIEEAYNTAKLFLDRLDEESPLRDSFKQIMHRLRKESSE